MAAFNKFAQFPHYVLIANINFSTANTHLFGIALTNTVPTSTMITSTDITNISTGNGYGNSNAGLGGSLGSTVAITSSTVAPNGAGTTSAIILASTVVFTASGGTIGPFRYPVICDYSTAYGGAPLLVGWYDYGTNITLNSGETFTVSFDGSSGMLQLA